MQSNDFTNVYNAAARNPELEARIQRLKIQKAERDYKKMTQNVSGRAQYTEEPLSRQSKSFSRSLHSGISYNDISL